MFMYAVDVPSLHDHAPLFKIILHHITRLFLLSEEFATGARIVLADVGLVPSGPKHAPSNFLLDTPLAQKKVK